MQNTDIIDTLIHIVQDWDDRCVVILLLASCRITLKLSLLESCKDI